MWKFAKKFVGGLWLLMAAAFAVLASVSLAGGVLTGFLENTLFVLVSLTIAGMMLSGDD